MKLEMQSLKIQKYTRLHSHASDANVSVPVIPHRASDANVPLPAMQHRVSDANVSTPAMQHRASDANVSLPAKQHRASGANVSIPAMQHRTSDANGSISAMQHSSASDASVSFAAMQTQGPGGQHIYTSNATQGLRYQRTFSNLRLTPVAVGRASPQPKLASTSSIWITKNNTFENEV